MKIKLITLSIILLSYLSCVGQEITIGLVGAYYFTNGSLKDAVTDAYATSRGNVNYYPYGSMTLTSVSANPTIISDRFGNTNSAYDFDVKQLTIDDGMGYPKYQYESTGLTMPNSNGMFEDMYTYSLWYKVTDGSASSSQFLLSIGNNGGDQAVSYYNTSIQGHTYYNDPYFAGGPPIYPVSSLSTSSLAGWNHFVSVRTPDSLKIYLNGVLKSKLEIPHISNGLTTPYYGTYPYNAIIGARYNLTTGFSGYLDDVKIFGRSLSDAEVLQEYNYSSINTYAEEGTTSVTSFSEEDKNIIIYPNPAQDKLEIRTETIQEYTLFSPEGLELKKGTTDKSLDISGLGNGIYFVKINNTMKKVVIQ
jgi:hypothetical protein